MSIFKFIMTYDFDRPEKKVVCDLIYVSNKYKLYPRYVQFGNPMEIDQRPDLDEDPNTYIDAVVSRDFDFRLDHKDSGFLYRRLPLAVLRLVDGVGTIVPPQVPFTTYQVLDQINAQFNSNLTEEDLEDIEYTSLDANLKIVAKPTSKVWMGWRYINVEGGGPSNILFDNDRLFTFVYPSDTLGDYRDLITGVANKENNTEHRELFDFDFGEVESYVDGTGRNSRIFVKAHKEGYIDQWLYYSRISPATIDDMFIGRPKPPISVTRQVFTTYEILEQVNVLYGLALTSEDVYNDAYQPGLGVYALRFKPTSRVWLKGEIVVVVNHDIDVKFARMVNGSTVRYTGSSHDTFRYYHGEDSDDLYPEDEDDEGLDPPVVDPEPELPAPTPDPDPEG